METENILWLDCVDSTNNYAKSVVKNQNCTEFMCFAAHEQTLGRGQRENLWHSESFKNLTFSLVLFPNFLQVENQFILSQAVALGVVDSFNSELSGFKIKWSNDIYFENKKIGGILIENSLTGKIISQSVIGIGLNINQEIFPEFLPNPISLFQITNKFYDLNLLLKKIVHNISKRYNTLRTENFLELKSEYLENLYKFNVWTDFKEKDTFFKGKIIGVENSGLLIIENKIGIIKKYDFKEIVFL